MSAHPVGPEKLDVEPSSRKLMAEHAFDHVSVAVSDGRGYGLQELLRPDVTSLTPVPPGRDSQCR